MCSVQPQQDEPYYQQPGASTEPVGARQSAGTQSAYCSNCPYTSQEGPNLTLTKALFSAAFAGMLMPWGLESGIAALTQVS